MSYDPNNVFARVLRGELPCRKVYEDELSILTSAYAGREPMPQPERDDLEIPAFLRRRV